ncbi:tyrosine-protein phosphatase non-receptor type 4-like [Centruroides vittatus]|uniref:tyrosine-protein phosphatase non-receptor type 4-like n=1 Tax=Centruroides vittatus TaxID=120091 RepID=UPI0035106863
MSRTTFVGLTATYNVRTSEIFFEKRRKTLQCTVFFLDDSQKTFEIEKWAKGHILLDLVFRHLELVEKDYFGLQFMEEKMSPENMRWLDPMKGIRKQIKFGPPYLLYFHVKFYVSDPSKLQDEYTRYHFFLQLRRDIIDQKLYVPLTAAILLASYAVQSQFGDYNPDVHKNGYLSGIQLVPNQTAEIQLKIMELHKLHKGQTPADAEFNFLDHAKRLDMYGVELHQARDSMNKEIQLGVTSAGLVVFQNNLKINTFSWAKILKISFKRRQFFIQLRREGTESYDNMVGFNMLNYRSCKNLWKSCVEHHTFFRLHAPQRPSRRLFFGVGSKFRYSGRTEYQTLEEGKKSARPEREFARTVSKRYMGPPVPRVIREGLDIYGKKPPRPVTRINGTSHIRPYDSLSKIKISESHYIPRKAWFTPSSDEAKAFVPNIPSKLIHYMDDDEEQILECTIYERETKVETKKYEESNIVTVRMKPDNQGRFGFNVKGGADQNLPIIVSRVVPSTPSDTCVPKLNEGDEILAINETDVNGMTHEQVVKLIKTSCDTATKELVLKVCPHVEVKKGVEEPDFQYIPDIPRDKSKLVRQPSLLDESILLLGDGLESGATIAQFEHLYRKKPGTTMKTAKLPENQARNRYKDILPYDTTRVILHGGITDYINASYVNMEIPNTGIINKYIATQGPLPNTCAEFWQMVWEQDSTIIVMVTTLTEQGQAKCYRYWPQSLRESIEYGPLQITLVQEEETPTGIFRQFSVLNVETNKLRRIIQMQYVSWPDHGVPEDDEDFFNFVGQIRQKRKETMEPIIVHCSAGVGRTGVVILMETVMCLIEANQPIYPLDIVRTMRNQRAMLIQTTSQYRYVCESILKVYNEEIVKPVKD